MITIVGENIRKYRKLKGLSQEKLAHLCDIETRMISQYENGKVDTNITMLCLIAEHLGIKPGQLFEEPHK